MNILIVKAHPSSKGFIHKICNAYEESCKKENKEVKVLDLYKKKTDYLEFESLKEFPNNKQIDEYKDLISWADELVFVFPIWWSDCPAVMKNFLDVSLQTGFAFKYENGKPDGLLKGKKAKIFATCDGHGVYYKFPFIAIGMKWKRGILGFCGINMTHFTLFDKMRKRDQKQKEKDLEKVRELAKK